MGVLAVCGVLFVVLVFGIFIFTICMANSSDLDDEEQMIYLEKWKQEHNIKDI